MPMSGLLRLLGKGRLVYPDLQAGKEEGQEEGEEEEGEEAQSSSTELTVFPDLRAQNCFARLL